LALLRLRRRLARLYYRLMGLRSCLALLRRSLTLWLLRSGLTLLRARCHLALLLLLRSRLARLHIRLVLLGRCLALLWRSRVLLLLRISLTLLRLRRHLTLLLWRTALVLFLLLRSSLALLLLLDGAIGFAQRWWSADVAIGSKWLLGGDVGGAAVICSGELGAVGAGRALILHLSPHGRSVLLVHRH
jgi:hypothetical protein